MTALAALLTLGAGIAAADPGPMRGHPGAQMGMMGDMMAPGGIDFVAIDTDGNGSLSRAELEARASARLARLDTSGDGVLDRDELIAAMPGPHGGIMALFAPDPAARFVDQLLAMVGGTETGQVEVAVLSDRRVNMLLAVADEDRDAAISQEEANAMRAHGHDRRDRRGPPPGRGPGGGRAPMGPGADGPGDDEPGPLE